MDTTNLPCTPQRAINPKILEAIINECIGLLERSEEGQRLLKLRNDLTDPIYKAFGFETGNNFENLVNNTLTLYGEGMFAYGLAIGRDATAALDLPDSGYDL